MRHAHTYLNVALFLRPAGAQAGTTTARFISPSPYQCRPGGERESNLHAEKR